MGKSGGSGESSPGGWEGRGQGTRPFPGLVWPPASSWPERSSQLWSVVVMCQLNPLARVSLLLMGTVASLSWGRKLPAACFPSAGNPGWWLARIPRSPWRICASSPRFCVLSAADGRQGSRGLALGCWRPLTALPGDDVPWHSCLAAPAGTGTSAWS